MSCLVSRASSVVFFSSLPERRAWFVRSHPGMAIQVGHAMACSFGNVNQFALPVVTGACFLAVVGPMPALLHDACYY